MFLNAKVQTEIVGKWTKDKDKTKRPGGRCHWLLFIQPGITIVKVYTLSLTWYYQQIEDGGMQEGDISYVVLTKVL
jgi:hypothetical protein